jgi:hypothetical protein
MNLFDLLKEHAGMSREEAEHYFRIENTATEYTMKSILYLEPTKFHAVLKLAAEYGGTYDPKAKGGIIHIPKEVNPASPEPRSDQKLEETLGHTPPVPESSEDYSLEGSLKGRFGQLVPCLADANGVIFDGLHRKAIIPDAWVVKNDKVKTELDRTEARLQTNFCRRDYTPEEMRDDIVFLVGIGFTPQQIHERNNVSLTTIYKYMPQEKKDQVRVEAGKLGGEARTESFATQAKQTVTTQDTSQPQIPQRIQRETLNEIVECANCHMGFHISKATLVDDKNVCPRCAEHVKPQPKPKIEPTLFKPKETGDYRKALMHPQKSKFELQVIQELQSEGLPLETDREFCVQKTTPDAVLKLKDRTIAIYIDNLATHQEGNERDDWLRGQLEKLYNVKVLPIRYKADTKEEVQRAKEQIREFLKW